MEASGWIVEIALYVFSVMYSPGPVNILGFNAGLTGFGRRSAGFCLGVGSAMFSWFMVLGYLGEAVATLYHGALPYIAVIGSAYILYLAYKMLFARVGVHGVEPPGTLLRFRDGYLLQVLNPKGMVVILPVTTIMFPAAHITGIGIFACAALISIGAVGAPGSYCAMGAIAGRRIRHTCYLGLFNKTMGMLLIVVALSIIYDFFIKA